MLIKRLVITIATVFVIVGCKSNGDNQKTQTSQVIIKPCYDIKRDLTQKYQGKDTRYFCGNSGKGAVKSTPVYLGSDGRIYPTPPLNPHRQGGMV